MAAQSERVEAVKRSSPVEGPADVEQLERVVEQICQDSQTDSRQYIEETTVPRGGE